MRLPFSLPVIAGMASVAVPLVLGGTARLAIPEELVLTSEAGRISGHHQADVIRIPKGEVVYVEDDVILEAKARLLVMGTLCVLDRPRDAKKSAAPRIELRSGKQFLLAGRVIGGTGQDFDHLPEPLGTGQQGGRGTDILVIAPELSQLGSLRGGAGGDSGWGAPGGTGGSVILVGSRSSKRPILPASIQSEPQALGGLGGAGGQGSSDYGQGASGGGGQGGASLSFASEDAYESWRKATVQDR